MVAPARASGAGGALAVDKANGLPYKRPDETADGLVDLTRLVVNRFEVHTDGNNGAELPETLFDALADFYNVLP